MLRLLLLLFADRGLLNVTFILRLAVHVCGSNMYEAMNKIAHNEHACWQNRNVFQTDLTERTFPKWSEIAKPCEIAKYIQSRSMMHKKKKKNEQEETAK